MVGSAEEDARVISVTARVMVGGGEWLPSQILVRAGYLRVTRLSGQTLEVESCARRRFGWRFRTWWKLRKHQPVPCLAERFTCQGPTQFMLEPDWPEDDEPFYFSLQNDTAMTAQELKSIWVGESH